MTVAQGPVSGLGASRAERRLFGRAGRDTLNGGSGNDRIEGGSGNDRLDGGDGDDSVYGGPGDDSVVERELIGGDGDDIVYSAYHLDRVYAGAGNDFIVRSGTTGVTLDCGPGVDTVISIDAGTEDPPSFKLAAGCERFAVVRDPVVIAQMRSIVDRASNRGRRAGGRSAAGGGSSDAAGAGFNRISGTGLDDTIVTRPPWRGGDELVGFTPTGDGGAFIITQRPPSSHEVTARDLVLGKAGDDDIRTGPADDHLEGEAGNDTLRGEAGNDLLYGRTGDDRLIGGAGDDLLEGGRGTDILSGGDGDDRLDGGIGEDELHGGAGRDRLTSVDGTRDSVDCGDGRDTAIVDSRDRVRGCELVKRGSGG